MLVWKTAQGVMCTRLMPGDRLWCNIIDGTFRFFRPVKEGEGTSREGMMLKPLYRATPVIGAVFDTLFLKKPNHGNLNDAELTDIVGFIAVAAGLEVKPVKWHTEGFFNRWFIFEHNARAGKIVTELNSSESPLMDNARERCVAGP